MKLKPVEQYELEHIEKADTFTVYCCIEGKTILEFPFNSKIAWKEATKLALAGEHKLVYAYNKKLEDSGACSRFILLDKKNIELYEKHKF